MVRAVRTVALVVRREEGARDAIGMAVGLRAASKDGFEQAFARMNG